MMEQACRMLFLFWWCIIDTEMAGMTTEMYSKTTTKYRLYALFQWEPKFQGGTKMWTSHIRNSLAFSISSSPISSIRHTNRSDLHLPALCLNVIILFLARNQTRLSTTTTPECFTATEHRNHKRSASFVLYFIAMLEHNKPENIVLAKSVFILFKKENTMRKTAVRQSFSV